MAVSTPKLNRYDVTATVVDESGIRDYTINVQATSCLDAESEAHLILTVGEGWTVLYISGAELTELG